MKIGASLTTAGDRLIATGRYPAGFLTGLAVLALAGPGPLEAQAPQDSVARCDTHVYRAYDVAGPGYDYGRLLEITGAARIRSRLLQRSSGIYETPVCAPPETLVWGHTVDEVEGGHGPRFELLPLTLRGAYNSAYPIDRNDGAMWSGVGATGMGRGGLRFQYGAFSAAVAPEVAVSQNRDFDIVRVSLAGHSAFIHPTHRTLIDLPQRFGEDTFVQVYPGQSYARLDTYGAAIGVSTENLWYGPARRYPILLSNTGPGLPHAFIGTSRPVDIWIGEFEADVFWGLLEESDYFDRDQGNDHQLLAGFSGAFRPRGVDGLYLGFSRMYQAQGASLEGADFLTRPFTSLSDNPRGGRDNVLGDNILIALWLRFVLPQSGFEVYGEWAREDNFEDLDDLAKEPDHSQGYTIGFQKVVDAGEEMKVRIHGELIHLDVSESSQSGRPIATFYIHGQVNQGFTNRGQLLGAFVGPGSNAQFLGVDLFADWGRTGVFVERIRRDSDEYFFRWAPFYGPQAHDLELSFGLEQVLFVGPLQLSGSLGYYSRANRNFIGLDEFTFDFIRDNNLGITFGLQYRPRVDLGSLLTP